MTSAIERWASRLGVPLKENSRVPSGIRKDMDPLKWVVLHLCGRVTLPEPHPSSAHHIWTPLKTTPGSSVAPGPRQCNLRVAVAACRITDGGFPLVQTGSERDPVKPWGQIRLLEW